MFWLLALLGLAALALGGSEDNGGETMVGSRAGYDKIRELGARAGLSQQHIGFLLLVARGESGGNNLRGLGIPEMFPPGTLPTQNAGALGVNEARAARSAYRSLKKQGRFDECGDAWSEDQYSFGSGGWFAFLPAYALAQFPKGSGLRCLPPSAVFDPVASICMAIGFARGLQGYQGFRAVPTVLNLRGGWGRPGQMGDLERLKKIHAHYDRQAREVGLPLGFVNQPIARFPGIDLAALYHQLKGTPSS